LEPIGPGAGVRGLFSAEGVPWVRWASANLHFFAVFCGFFAGFCRLFVAIWCFSHPCHVHTFMLITFFPRLWRGICAAFNAAGHGRGRSPAREIAEACPERAACPEPVEGSESKGRKGRIGGKKVQNAECRVQNGRQTAGDAAGEKQDGMAGNACRRKSPYPPNSSLESSQLSSMSPELLIGINDLLHSFGVPLSFERLSGAAICWRTDTSRIHDRCDYPAERSRGVAARQHVSGGRGQSSFWYTLATFPAAIRPLSTLAA